MAYVIAFFLCWLLIFQILIWTELRSIRQSMPVDFSIFQTVKNSSKNNTKLTQSEKYKPKVPKEKTGDPFADAFSQIGYN